MITLLKMKVKITMIMLKIIVTVATIILKRWNNLYNDAENNSNK